MKLNKTAEMLVNGFLLAAPLLFGMILLGAVLFAVNVIQGPSDASGGDVGGYSFEATEAFCQGAATGWAVLYQITNPEAPKPPAGWYSDQVRLCVEDNAATYRRAEARLKTGDLPLG